jgi:hypothetical protein
LPPLLGYNATGEYNLQREPTIRGFLYHWYSVPYIKNKPLTAGIAEKALKSPRLQAIVPQPAYSLSLAPNHEISRVYE